MSEELREEFKNIPKEIWNGIKYAAIWAWERYAREIICLSIGFLLGLLIMSMHTDRAVNKVSEKYENQIAEIHAEEKQNEMDKATEGQKISLYRNVARALYGVHEKKLSDDAKKAYIQIMLNRADPNVQYDIMKGTDDLASVLAVPNQWEGYRPDGKYTEDDFQLVKEFLESGQGNILNSDKYYWCEIKQGYIICKADINGKTSIPDQVVQ